MKYKHLKLFANWSGEETTRKTHEWWSIFHGKYNWDAKDCHPLGLPRKMSKTPWFFDLTNSVKNNFVHLVGRFICCCSVILWMNSLAYA